MEYYIFLRKVCTLSRKIITLSYSSCSKLLGSQRIIINKTPTLPNLMLYYYSCTQSVHSLLCQIMGVVIIEIMHNSVNSVTQ